MVVWSNFATVHFTPSLLRAARVKLSRLLQEMPREGRAYATFEQDGDEPTSMGTAPHLHLVTLFPRDKEMTARQFALRVRRAFPSPQYDFQMQRDIGLWRSGDLILRYLAGHKKGLRQDVVDTTRRWRQRMGLPHSLEVRQPKRYLLQYLSPEALDSIDARIKATEPE